MFSTPTFDRNYNGDYCGINVGDTVVVIDKKSKLFEYIGTVKDLEYGEVGVQYEEYGFKWTPFTALSKISDESDISFKTTITQII